MRIELNGFALDLILSALVNGQWIALELPHASGEVESKLTLEPKSDTTFRYTLAFRAPFATRLRLRGTLSGESELFHLIPGNIHGDNNAPYVRPGEFPCLTDPREGERNRARLWEFRTDRASHPVSMLCCARGAVGVAIDPYSDSAEAPAPLDGFVRNGVFAELPNHFGVSLGYGNDPLTFVEKTHFQPPTADLCRGGKVQGTIYAFRGDGRREAHRIIRELYEQMHERPTHRRSYEEALRALADAFAEVNYSPELNQYTNRKCQVPVDRELKPWRAIVEIGWTGGSMLAYPFALAERIFPDLKMPKTSSQIFDEICGGWNETSGFIDDATLNRQATNRPEGWNDSFINGWWSGFLPNTRDNHCSYTNAHAAYYILETPEPKPLWIKTALAVLDSAIELQRHDGAFGYIFSHRKREVVDFDGFAGCWFAAALPLAWKWTGDDRYRASAERALRFYWPFVRELACWGSPMDTFKSVDSEGNLAFIRAARLMHEMTNDNMYLNMLRDGANYEYLWRYGFRTRPQVPPLKGSQWNSCGGTITSVSNPHIHPMGVVATDDLEYLATNSGDDYHRQRADDGIAWLLNTMELYPNVVGYGRYGVLSERTCPSDGLLVEQYYDTGAPASTWWSYNAWAAGSAMEAIALRILRQRSSA